MLAISFLTDAVDGSIARKLKNTSARSSSLDSIGDDLTFAVAAIGLAITRHEFLLQHWSILAALAALYLIQLASALKKYGRISSFHTYLAKVAAVFQAIFLLSIFFFAEICYPLFYAAFIFTALDLIEEIALVFVIPEWETDVKGLYWVRKKQKSPKVNNELR